MNMKTHKGKKCDSWAVYYRLRTRIKTRGPYAWFMFDVTDGGALENGVPSTMFAPTKADYDRGKALNDSLKSGEKTFDAGAATEETVAPSTSDTM